MHLWEVDHPYYMNEGCYYKAGCHEKYESFAEFLAAWGDADIDMNRVHRWDWREGEDWEIPTAQEGGEVAGVLMIYYIMQRKARTYSCEISVTRKDEGAVKRFLIPHFARERALWSPLSD